MKFTDKEKRILQVLAILMILFAYGFFFLKPQMSQIFKIRDEIKFVSSTNRDSSVVKAEIANFDNDLKKLKDNISKIRSKLPDTYEEEELIIDMIEISKASGVEIVSINFADPMPLGFAGAASTTVTPEAGNNAQLSTEQVAVSDQKIKNIGEEIGFISHEKKDKLDIQFVPDGQGFSIDINLSANGSYQEVKKFAEVVESKKNLNVFKQFLLSKAAEDKLNIKIVMTYFGIKETLKKNYYFENPKEKIDTDLFKPFLVRNTRNPLFNKISKVTIENVNNVADFYARLLPFGNGFTPQTLTLSAKKVVREEGVKPVVLFGDNQFQEEVVIHVEEVGGRFYLKMKTGSNAFPDDEFENTTEFEPAGENLKFFIDSTIRKAKNDYSKVNFIITNESSKVFDILIVNDDPVIPRVNITKKSKNIRVIEQEGGA